MATSTSVSVSRSEISTSLADDEVDMAALCGEEVLLNKPDPATGHGAPAIA